MLKHYGVPASHRIKERSVRSVNNIVIPPANTGNDNNYKTLTKIDHTNKGIRVQLTPAAHILKIVLIKLISRPQDRRYTRQMQTKNSHIHRWPRMPHAAR